MVLGMQDDFAMAAVPGMFSADTVTLTRAQLKAILEAVGQVGGLQLTDDLSKSHNSSGNSVQGYYPGSENLPYSQQNDNSATQDENLNGFSSVDARLLAASSLPSSQHAPAVSSSNFSPPSKLQQKRRQWELERGESEVWSPWGRPGGGAPRRSVVMATVSPSTTGDLLKSQPRGYSGYSCFTSDSFPGSTASGPRVPDFLKSSLPFGPGSDIADVDDPSEKKRQWRLELEQQREEQRRRRSNSLQHEEHTSDLPDGDRWGFEEENEDITPDQQMATGRYSGMNSPASTVTGTARSFLRGQNALPLDAESSSRLMEQRERALEYQRSIQQQVEEKKQKQAEEKERRRREEELEEQRLEQERQQIREQYEREQRMSKEKEEREERKRQMMEVAVQKARAEAEADKRAKKAQRLSTGNISLQTPQATPKHTVPSVSRLSLRPDDHRVSGTGQTLEPRLHDSATSSACTSPKALNKSAHQQTATVYPVRSSPQPAQRVPPLDATDYSQSEMQASELKEMSAQTDRPMKLPPEPSAYVANRLLTPSVWRTRERRIAAQNAWGHHRDMATQTDQPLSWNDDDDHSDCPASSVDDRSSRNTSATSSKRSCGGKSISKSESGNRPIWGANQPVKSFVKMTDRDPNHSRRKKFQEMRRQHWEREMASLRDQLAVARSRSRVNLTQSTATGTTTPTAAPSAVAGTSVSPRLGRARVGSDSAFQVRRRVTPQGQSGKGSERDSAWSSAGSSLYAVSANSLGTTYTASSNDVLLPTLSRRWSHSNEQIPHHGRQDGHGIHHEEYEEPDLDEREGPFFPPVRRKWHSQESFNEPTSQQQQQPRPHTPSVLDAGDESLHPEDRPVLFPPPPPRRKWSEQGSFDPAAVALSRQLGTGDSDSEKGSPDPPPDRPEPDPSQDPLVNPKMVTSRPTPRQDRILQQLSTLRQGLLQKQREIETLVRQPPTWTS